MTYPCQVAGCPNPGPWKDVPSLAAHAWAAHGTDVPDTYAAHGYRDRDITGRGPKAGPKKAPRPAKSAARADRPDLIRRAHEKAAEYETKAKQIRDAVRLLEEVETL